MSTPEELRTAIAMITADIAQERTRLADIKETLGLRAQRASQYISILRQTKVCQGCKMDRALKFGSDLAGFRELADLLESEVIPMLERNLATVSSELSNLKCS